MQDINFNDPKDLAIKIIKGGCCETKVLVVHIPTGLFSYGYDVKNACDLISRQANSRRILLQSTT
jgi:hypothetical protein